MLFGFALVCSVNLLCFFPQTILHISPEMYRVYNLAAGLSLVGGSSTCALLALSRLKRPEIPLLAIGYLLLTTGMLVSYLVGDGSNQNLVVAAGVSCGFALGVLMVCWFSFLALFKERTAMFLQGGQALLGSLVFVLLAALPSYWVFAVALLCLLVSAALSFVIIKHGLIPQTDLLSQDSLRKNFRLLSDGGNLGLSFSVSSIAFVVISLLLGIIIAVTMSPDNSSDSLAESTFGGILGAGAFLLWARYSKNVDFGFVIKLVFGVLAFVLILPLQGHALAIGLGYQVIGLLFFALLIDTFSSSRRMLLLALAVGYAITRGVFLIGLYIPGQFGVTNYEQFFGSASLLVFVVYLIFLAILFVLSRERNRLKKQQESEPAESSEQQLDGISAQLDENTSASLSHDIIRASEALGKRNALTKREIELLGYLARGRDTAFICSELHLSRNTVKSYTKTIYAKLQVHSRQELIDLVDAEC